jgi:hypothetical protein
MTRSKITRIVSGLTGAVQGSDSRSQLMSLDTLWGSMFQSGVLICHHDESGAASVRANF